MITLTKPSGTYRHGIDLGNWYPCWNLSLCGMLMAPDYSAMGDSGLRAAHTSVRDVSIDFLRAEGLPQGTMTPRAAWYVWAAALIRNGKKVGVGMDDTKWLSHEKMDQILRLGDIELELEEIRRNVNPNAASRLCSLWVAEDSDAGEAHIRSMVEKDVFVLRVSVPSALRFTKVDTTWFDLYCETRERDYAINYWNGTPNENMSTWEFLVEGCIEAIDSKEIEHIRKYGVHLQLQKQQKGSGPK